MGFFQKVKIDVESDNPLEPFYIKVPEIASEVRARIFFFKYEAFCAYQVPLSGTQVSRLQNLDPVCQFMSKLDDGFFTSAPFGFKMREWFVKSLEDSLDSYLNYHGYLGVKNTVFYVEKDIEKLRDSKRGWKLEDALAYIAHSKLEKSAMSSYSSIMSTLLGIDNPREEIVTPGRVECNSRTKVLEIVPSVYLPKSKEGFYDARMAVHESFNNKTNEPKAPSKKRKVGDTIRGLVEGGKIIGHVQIASIERFGEKDLFTYAIYLSESYMNKSDSETEMVLVDNCIDPKNWLVIKGMKGVELISSRLPEDSDYHPFSI